MTIRVKLPNGKYGQFPDGTPHEQIEEVLRKQFPQKMDFNEYLKQGVSDYQQGAERIGKNAAVGVLEAGRGFANLPHNLAAMVGKGEQVPELAPSDFDYSKALGLNGPTSLADKLIRGLAQYAPAMALPAANLGRAGQALKAIPKAGEFLGEAASQAAPQAAYGATQNENPISGAIEGGLGSLAGSGIGQGIASGLNKLRPSQMLRGELSPQQLKKNLEVTKGTKTNLGEVIQSPTLKRVYENILPHVIGSGAEKTMQNTASAITNKGQDIIKDLVGNVPAENYGQKIQQALKTSAKDVEGVKNSKFNRVNELAEEAKVSTPRHHFRSEAEALLKQVHSDPDLAKFTNASDIKLLEDLAYGESKKTSTGARGSNTYEGNVDIHGKPVQEVRDPLTGELVHPEVATKQIAQAPKTQHPGEVSTITGKRVITPKNYSLKNTDILRGKIGELAHEAHIKGEKPKGAIYQRLKNALEKDVSTAIEDSGSDALKKAHKEAMEHYKNEYALYQDPDIAKFIKKGGDPDTILSHFIKGGKNDRATLLTKLTKGMLQEPNGTKNLLAGSYFSRAIDNEGQLNPVELSTLYHNLGKNQRKALFGDEKLHKEFKNYVDLINKNKEAFTLMFNPKKSARNTVSLGHIGSLIAGSLTGSLPGFLGSLAATGYAGKQATRLLTSPTYREKLVNAMIKNQQINLPKTKKGLQKGAAVLAGEKGNDKEQKPLEIEVVGHRK